jgi:hypothetical protein
LASSAGAATRWRRTAPFWARDNRRVMIRVLGAIRRRASKTESAKRPPIPTSTWLRCKQPADVMRDYVSEDPWLIKPKLELYRKKFLSGIFSLRSAKKSHLPRRHRPRLLSREVGRRSRAHRRGAGRNREDPHVLCSEQDCRSPQAARCKCTLIAAHGSGYLLQSSSASRFTAGAATFLNLSQSADRPEP